MKAPDTVGQQTINFAWHGFCLTISSALGQTSGADGRLHALHYQDTDPDLIMDVCECLASMLARGIQGLLFLQIETQKRQRRHKQLRDNIQVWWTSPQKQQHLTY
jgi:hypothetical protein